jgi:hypothetical protein
MPHAKSPRLTHYPSFCVVMLTDTVSCAEESAADADRTRKAAAAAKLAIFNREVGVADEDKPIQ